jgi:hypothetical protein
VGGFPLGRAQVTKRAVEPVRVVPAFDAIEDGPGSSATLRQALVVMSPLLIVAKSDPATAVVGAVRGTKGQVDAVGPGQRDVVLDVEPPTAVGTKPNSA